MFRVESSFVLCCGLVACATGPSEQPQEQFGRIVAAVRGEQWVSELRADFAVAEYESATGSLNIRGSYTDSLGYFTSLTLSLCGARSPGVYPFARNPNGPFGIYALKLGALGYWWEPSDPVRKPMPDWGYSGQTLESRGGLAEAVIIESIDVPGRRIRGSFRFRAISPGGMIIAPIRGRFSGRLTQGAPGCVFP